MSNIEFKTPNSDEERQRLSDAYSNEPCNLHIDGLEWNFNDKSAVIDGVPYREYYVESRFGRLTLLLGPKGQYGVIS